MRHLTRRALFALFAVTALAVGAVATHPAPARAEAADKISVPDGFPERVLGDPAAPVTIYEYSSLTCPHCAAFHAETLPELKKRFIDTGKAKLVYRDFPLDRLALVGHLMARCAPEPLYFRLMDVLFAQQREWAGAKNPVQAMTQYARLAGMSDETINACLKNETLLSQIQSIQDQAQKVYGINSTPSFVIDGKVLSGNQPVDTFAKAIEDAN